MSKLYTLGVYGYQHGDHRLARVLAARKYQLVWLCTPGQSTYAMEYIVNNPVDVLVINPFHEAGLAGFREIVPETTEVVCRNNPFGADCILPPLEEENEPVATTAASA